MRKPIVSRTLTLTKYRCYIRDRTTAKEKVFALPHGPRSVAKIKEQLSKAYDVIILDVIEMWQEKELRGMDELEFYFNSVPLTEDRKIQNTLPKKGK